MLLVSTPVPNTPYELTYHNTLYSQNHSQVRVNQRRTLYALEPPWVSKLAPR